MTSAGLEDAFVLKLGASGGFLAPVLAWSLRVALKPLMDTLRYRADPKVLGRIEQMEGELQEGETVLLVEDVLTTGGQVLEAAKTLTDAEVDPVMDTLMGAVRAQGWGTRALDDRMRREQVYLQRRHRGGSTEYHKPSSEADSLRQLVPKGRTRRSCGARSGTCALRLLSAAGGPRTAAVARRAAADAARRVDAGPGVPARVGEGGLRRGRVRARHGAAHAARGRGGRGGPAAGRRAGARATPGRTSPRCRSTRRPRSSPW